MMFADAIRKNDGSQWQGKETMLYDAMLLVVFLGGLSGVLLAGGAIMWLGERALSAWRRWMWMRARARTERRPPSIVRF